MANSSTTSTTTTSNSTSICSESNYSSAPPQNFYLDEKWKLSKKLEGSSPRIRRCSSKRCGFASKCARLVKEQRARFYIMRRCVIMLICWRDYSDS